MHFRAGQGKKYDSANFNVEMKVMVLWFVIGMAHFWIIIMMIKRISQSVSWL